MSNQQLIPGKNCNYSYWLRDYWINIIPSCDRSSKWRFVITKGLNDVIMRDTGFPSSEAAAMAAQMFLKREGL